MSLLRRPEKFDPSNIAQHRHSIHLPPSSLRLKNQISSHSWKDPESHNIGIMSNTFYAWTCAEESLRILVEWAQDGEPKHQTGTWNLNSFTKWNFTYRFSAFFLLGVVAWNKGLIPGILWKFRVPGFFETLPSCHMAACRRSWTLDLYDLVCRRWSEAADAGQSPAQAAQIFICNWKLTWPVFCDYAECILPNDMCDYVGI